MVNTRILKIRGQELIVPVNDATGMIVDVSVTGDKLRITYSKGTVAEYTVSTSGGGISEIPKASADTLGGVKIGSGISITGDGTISTTEVNDATTETKGIIKIGEGLAVTNGVASVDTNYIAVKAYVDSRVADLVNSSADMVNALDQLQEALENDHELAVALETQISEKVDKVIGKDLSSKNYTQEEKDKLATVQANANYVVVDSEISSTSSNPVMNRVVKDYVDTQVAGLVNSSSDALAAIRSLQDALADDPDTTAALSTIGNKVDKVEGKQLSTEDYTTAEKNKLAGIAANANNFVLTAATSEALGGVKIGDGLAIEDGVVSVNNSVVADRTYVDNKVADLVNGAPAALDTLKELSDALGGDVNYATTISTKLGVLINVLKNAIYDVREEEGVGVVFRRVDGTVAYTLPYSTGEIRDAVALAPFATLTAKAGTNFRNDAARLAEILMTTDESYIRYWYKGGYSSAISGSNIALTPGSNATDDEHIAKTWTFVSDTEVTATDGNNYTLTIKYDGTVNVVAP